MKVMQYHVVGSKGEYEDFESILIGVFDNKDAAQKALDEAIVTIRNGRAPHEAQYPKRYEFGVKWVKWWDYNLEDFVIEEIPLNEVLYKPTNS